MVQVILLEPFRAWFLELAESDARSVMHVLHLLEQLGLQLGAPHSSALEGTDYPFRELRPKAGHSPLRIIYAFDPDRAAVIILGGDKSGEPKFYKRIIEQSESIWEEHLTAIAERRAHERKEDEDEKKKK